MTSDETPSADSPEPTDAYLTVGDRLRIPLAELEMIASRSSGPGGQNVNKTASRVQLRWDLESTVTLPEDVRDRLSKQEKKKITRDGVLQLTSQQFRTQLANRRACLRMLTESLEKALIAPVQRKKTRPSAGAKRRRLQAKREQSEKKSRRRPPKLSDE